MRRLLMSLVVLGSWMALSATPVQADDGRHGNYRQGHGDWNDGNWGRGSVGRGNNGRPGHFDNDRRGNFHDWDRGHHHHGHTTYRPPVVRPVAPNFGCATPYVPQQVVPVAPYLPPQSGFNLTTPRFSFSVVR